MLLMALKHYKYKLSKVHIFYALPLNPQCLFIIDHSIQHGNKQKYPKWFWHIGFWNPTWFQLKSKTQKHRNPYYKNHGTEMIRLPSEATSDTYGVRLQLNIAYKMRFCKSPVKKCRKCLFGMFFTLEDKKQRLKSTCVFMGKVTRLKGNSTSLHL